MKLVELLDDMCEVTPKGRQEVIVNLQRSGAGSARRRRCAAPCRRALRLTLHPWLEHGEWIDRKLDRRRAFQVAGSIRQEGRDGGRQA